ncbi:autotransporter outer membrane beta-barrel domain-containing protein [Pseudomonas sp. QTF5]|uniref:autotransporter outer membrane beta-barrel domain-containing protein n=1 Tax=Pseudomonas sp. QTF5 TaxID=1435425 RepID=UPI002113F09D|nr:autotransporter outer membrane beta-barrel domain-containing protein [Pseudomonas sp. QTF5]
MEIVFLWCLMKNRNALLLQPLSASLKWAPLLPFLLVSTHSMARILDNETAVINGNVSADNYLLRNNSALTANGATTREIRADTGSKLTLNGATVTSVGSPIAVDLVDASANITRSIVTGTSTGLSLGTVAANPQGSSSSVTDSVITGGTNGASVGNLSVLALTRTVLTGTSGQGLQIANGLASATDSKISGGRNGVLFTPGGTGNSGRLVLDNTDVVGQSGSAILINDFGLSPIIATVEVGNGSTLVGGNGNLLEVKGSSTANMTVDNSHLVGDVTVESGAFANITLQNQSTLTGQLDNVSSLAVNSGARWVMVGDGNVGNVELNGGGIQFGNPGEFYKLTVGNLAGEGGTFYMHTNFGVVDTLTVTGTASGNHLVSIDSSGSEPVAAGSIPVVHIGGGDAQFTLLGGEVDLGAFSYDLIKQGDKDWYLNTTSRTISPGTRSVLALFNTAPTVWYGELSTLRTRMGEVRMDHGKAGGWVRAYGNKYDVSANSGVAYQQTQQGLSFGADGVLPAGDGQWLVGLLGGYSQSDIDLSRGTSGTVDSYYLGAYTTWMDEPSGYYFDGVLKFNRFQNKSDVQLSDGDKTKGHYNNNGVGASLEFGRHIKLADDYFVEPYTQLSGVIIQGQDYDLDNGLVAEGDRTRSLLGKVGATAGRNFNLGENKTVQPYIRVAYVHEFAKNNEVEVNNNVFNNNLSGSRGELGTGIAVNINEAVSMHVDLDYSNGDKIEQPWGFNVGARYRW